MKFRLKQLVFSGLFLLAFSGADRVSAACSAAPASDNSAKLSDGTAPTPTPTADEATDYEAWLKASEVEFGQQIDNNCNGRVLLATHFVVDRGPLDAAFSKALALTYDRVMLDLQAQHIMQLYGQIAVKQLSEFFLDDSTNKQQFDALNLDAEAPSTDTSLVEVMISKITDGKDSVLDQVLVKQGAAQDKVKQLTVPQKKQLFKDNFKKSAFKQAIGSMAGLVPIRTKTFTTSTSVGDAVEVAVLAVVSDKSRQFADDIAHRRPTNVKGAPRKLEEILPTTKEGYLNELGLRMVYDEQGRPMLVSYGRWGLTSKTDNPAQFLRFKQSAVEAAQTQAETYIAGFLQTCLMTSSSVDANQLSEEIATRVSTIEVGNTGKKLIGQNDQTEQVREILDVQMKKIAADAKAMLRGTNVQKTWDMTDKNKVIHFGTVVTWSYEKLENDNSIVNNKPKAKPASASAQEASPENKTSKNVNSADDF